MSSTITQMEQLTHLGQIVSLQAESNGSATALFWRGNETSYTALNQRIHQLATRIASIGQPGTRIGVLAANNPDYVALLYAIPLAGRIMVPLNTRLAPPELHYQIEKTQPAVLFGDKPLIQKLNAACFPPTSFTTVYFGEAFDRWIASANTSDLPELQGCEAAWLLFTSGTTGRPKGAVLTHRSLLAGLVSGFHGRPVNPDDRYLYPFPLFHVSAHNVLLQHKHGACVALLPAFDAAEVLDCCKHYHITTMSLAPTMINIMLDHPDFDRQSLASVKTIGYGASAISGSLLNRVMQETGVGLSQGFGMTELSGSIAFLDSSDHLKAMDKHPQRLKSVGKPVPGVEVQLVDDSGKKLAPGETGEIVVRAEQVLDNYWQDAAATRQAIVDGWFHTGDIGRFDEDGYLYIVDRKKDMILSGGENIASREVEDVIQHHPLISQASVVGLPDEKWGEIVCAVVVPVGGKETVHSGLEQEIIDFCRDKLANYKRPKQVIICDTLPANASGKFDKVRIRKIAIDKLKPGNCNE